jgi:hypothetical protein
MSGSNYCHGCSRVGSDRRPQSPSTMHEQSNSLTAAKLTALIDYI